MNDPSLEATLLAVIQRLLAQTIKLVRLTTGMIVPSKACSGFLFDRSDDQVTVLTARHSFDEPGCWYMELDVAPEQQSILVPLPESERREISPLLDVTWWDVNLCQAKNQAGTDPKLGTLPKMPRLSETVTRPVAGETRYAFAAYNRMESYPPIPRLGGIRGLERKPAYELAMEFAGLVPRNGLYRFTLARMHQGNAYYSGASGAPIFDDQDRLTSFVVSGCENEDLIYGFPLADHARELGLRVI